MAQEDLSPPSPAMETELYKNLPAWLQDPALKLPAMVADDQRLHMPNQPLPKNMGNYSFVPLRRLPEVAQAEQQSGEPAKNFYGGYEYDLADHIKTHFWGLELNRPFIEAPFAIGIVINRPNKQTGANEQHLCAVAAACLDGTNVRVTQLQGAVNKGEDDPALKIGPQLGGFRWAEALVKAWQTIAARLGASGLGLAQPTQSYGKIYQRAGEAMGLRKSSGQPRLAAGSVPPAPPLPSRNIAGGDRSAGALRRNLIKIAAQIGEGEDSPRAILLSARWHLHCTYDLLLDAEDFTRRPSELWTAVDEVTTAMDGLTNLLATLSAAEDAILRYQQRV